MCTCVRTVIYNTSINGAGITFIKSNGDVRIITELADIESDIVLSGCDNIGISLESDAAVVEAQRIVQTTSLIFCVKMHIFQGQICVILNDTADGSCSLRNADGSVFESNVRIL